MTQSMVWRAYLDDSGNLEHSPVLVLGGWIAPISVWTDFIPAWDDMLGMRPAIEYFKMNEAATRIGQFKDWSESRANERVALAYKTIEERIPYQVSVIVDLEPFYRIFTADWVERSSINPYYLAFSAVVSGVARLQGNFGMQGPVEFVFDDQTEKRNILKGWEKFKGNISPETRPLVGEAPAFLNDKKIKPLQAADLIAWWIRQLKTKGVEPDQRPWKSSKQIPGIQIYFNEDRLKAERAKFVPSKSD